MKNLLINSVGVLLISVAASSCKNATVSLDEFNTEIYTPTYATGFTITGAEGKESSIINITRPWQGADSVVTQLFIARGGEKAPDGFTGQVINGDAKRIVTMSSTHIAMLDAIGATDRIAGVSGLRFVANPYIKSHMDDIADVGYDGNYNYELLLGADPDLVLLYGIYSASQLESKLVELNIPYMYVSDYTEESPLGKAEWVMAIAEITGNRELGNEVWSKIPENYNRLKDSVASSITAKPSVMLNTPYGDSWFMPPAGSYMVTLINDAGGDYIYKGNETGQSKPIDIEEAYMLTSAADFWLNVGQCSSIQELKSECQRMADARCVTEGRIYNNTLKRTPGGGNDFYESGIMHPDIVLQDLIKILHPELVENQPFVYYTKLD